MDDDYDMDAGDMGDDSADMVGQKGGMAGPVTVETYLDGVNYPANKQELMDKAMENGAPKEVLNALEILPDQSYDNPNNITEAMGKMW